MIGAGIVEGGSALQMKRDTTADNADAPDQFFPYSADAADRHVILDFSHTFVVQKTGDEDSGVRPVELLVPKIVSGGGNSKAPAFVIVKYGGKDARGVEVRQAQPVNRAIHSHQSRRTHVADNSIILDRLVVRWHEKVLRFQLNKAASSVVSDFRSLETG